MATQRGKKRTWWTVYCARDEVYRCLAFSEKEALDDFEGTLDGTLDEFAAERGCTFEDVTAQEDR